MKISFIDWAATVISGTTVTVVATVNEATVTKATVIPPIPVLRPF